MVVIVGACRYKGAGREQGRGDRAPTWSTNFKVVPRARLDRPIGTTWPPKSWPALHNSIASSNSSGIPSNRTLPTIWTKAAWSIPIPLVRYSLIHCLGDFSGSKPSVPTVGSIAEGMYAVDNQG